jgi:hypothetical protein
MAGKNNAGKRTSCTKARIFTWGLLVRRRKPTLPTARPGAGSSVIISAMDARPDGNQQGM